MLEQWAIELCQTVMGDRLQAYGYELSGAASLADEHLEEYGAVVAKRRRQLEEEREHDRSILDVQPVADTPIVHPQQERIRALEGHVATLEQQVSKVTRDRNSQKAKLDRVLSSRAWHLTKPLHAVRKALPGDQHNWSAGTAPVEAGLSRS